MVPTNERLAADFMMTEYKCEPVSRELTETEKKDIEVHRQDQCPNGGCCKDIHLTIGLRSPDDPLQHGCVVCGEAIA